MNNADRDSAEKLGDVPGKHYGSTPWEQDIGLINSGIKSINDRITHIENDIGEIKRDIRDAKVTKETIKTVADYAIKFFGLFLGLCGVLIAIGGLVYKIWLE